MGFKLARIVEALFCIQRKRCAACGAQLNPALGAYREF